MLLIDGDILLFKFACTNEGKVNFGSGSVTVKHGARAARQLDLFVKWLQRISRTKEYIIIFSGYHNFRYDVLPTYKHNRADKAAPELRAELREYCEENHPVEWRDNLEADDLLGIMSTSKPGRFCIATLDKDLDQIPGWHLNWNKPPSEQMYFVEPENGLRWLYMQTLTGDSVDGYKGCPGIGPKKAAKALNACEAGEEWDVIVNLYEKKGLTEEDALQQARVAFMLTHEYYNDASGEITLWTPPHKEENENDE